MFQELQAILALMNPPDEVRIGEAFMLHQSLAAYYYGRRKVAIAAKACKSPDLKEWYTKARRAIDERIPELETKMKEMNIPLPPALQESDEADDEYFALDAAAFLRGMLTADSIALQSVLRGDVATLYYRMFNNTLLFSAQLYPIMTKHKWVPYSPIYEQPQQQ